MKCSGNALLLSMVLVLLAGCAAGPTRHGAPPVEERGATAPSPTSPEAAPTPAMPSTPHAAPVAALVARADRDAKSGRLDAASATLERALRIAPGDARLWHRLAAVRLAAGDAAQARSLAAKSNALAGNDRALQAANWRVIAAARRALGDASGARAADEEARRLEGR